MLEEETRQKEELRDALTGADRRVQAVQGELDEMRALLEQVSILVYTYREHVRILLIIA